MFHRFCYLVRFCLEKMAPTPHTVRITLLFELSHNTTCASLSLRSSFVCGLAGALASNPVDVVRTRMMNQRGVALYQGTLDCLLQVSENS